MTSPKPKLPEIPEAELTPMVQQLLGIILRQQEQIEELQEEIRRLKGHKGKPLIKPSRMDKEAQGAEEAGKERKRGPQRAKTAQLQAVDEVIAPDGLPAEAREQGWRFKGYADYVVQDLVIEARNINGKNGYCTYIGNDFFAWFESTESKSRVNFLSLLRAGHQDYVLNAGALAYMAHHKLPQVKLNLLEEGQSFEDKQAWEGYLDSMSISAPRHRLIATEGALVGSLLPEAFRPPWALSVTMPGSSTCSATPCAGFTREAQHQ